MRTKRRYSRHIRRLETEFSVGDKHYRAISSDFSIGGLFVRTNHAYAPETIVDLTVHLPDGNTSKLKGIVRRAYKTPGVALKNGMGMELVEKDQSYINFIRSFAKEDTPETTHETTAEPVQIKTTQSIPEPPAPDFLIIPCPNCGVKNRVRSERLNSARCGKCSAPLQTTV